MPRRPRTFVCLAVALTLLLPFGAAITFAVAWAVVVLDFEPTAPKLSSTLVMGADAKPYFCEGFNSRFGFQSWSIARARDDGLTYPPLPAWINLPSSQRMLAASRTSGFGWPVLCVKFHDDDTARALSPDSWVWTRGQPNTATYKEYRLPLAILPARFAADTAFYDLVMLAVVGAYPLSRRILRHRRGQCLRCGYDRNGLNQAPCPECGHIPA